MDAKEISHISSRISAPGLDQMHDIVQPDPVSWWPLAPGWWVLLGILTLVVLVLAVRALLRWRKNAFRREALKQLDAISANEIPQLVKRVSLCVYPRETVARLSGEPWLQFLDNSGNTTAFTRGAGRMLSELSYQPQTDLSREDRSLVELKQVIRKWILTI